MGDTLEIWLVYMENPMENPPLKNGWWLGGSFCLKESYYVRHDHWLVKASKPICSSNLGEPTKKNLPFEDGLFVTHLWWFWGRLLVGYTNILSSRDGELTIEVSVSPPLKCPQKHVSLTVESRDFLPMVTSSIFIQTLKENRTCLMPRSQAGLSMLF